MILQTKEFKEKCAAILDIVSTEILELKTESNILYLNVANNNYYVSVKFNLETPESLHALVSANIFLKLISQVTSDTIELKLNSNYLAVKANGNYKIPFVTLENGATELSQIKIDNVVTSMNVSGDILLGILTHNSKELQKAERITADVQSLYYLNNTGCVTFTNYSICYNAFTLEKPVEILLTQKLVKLFKLFNKNDSVVFTVGCDAHISGINQTKVRFETGDILLTAITTCNNTLLKNVPVNAINTLVNKVYPNSIVVSSVELQEALERLLLFAGSKSKTEKGENIYRVVGTITIDQDGMNILGYGDNLETVPAESGSKILSDYSFKIKLDDLLIALNASSEQYLTINYGDSKSIILVRGNIKNVLAESKGRN